MTTDPIVIVHWRSLHGPETGRSANTLTRSEARRAIGTLNKTQAGDFHWWYVLAPVVYTPDLAEQYNEAVGQAAP